MGFWDVFKNAIFYVINWLYGLVGDWGLAIVLITIIFRILILPITIRQMKSSASMQKMQPKIKEIQTKYADDRVRQQQEMAKIYSDSKFNPLSGCLPMLLQMPIFMALFQVLRELESLISAAGYPDSVLPASFYSILPDLSHSAGDVFSFTLEGILACLPYLVMLLIFSVSMLVPMLLNKNFDRNNLMITGMMSVMMLWLGWGSPAGVLLYWDTSSIIGIGQQLVMNQLNKRKEAAIEEEMADITPVKVEVVRKEHKSRPRKSR